MREKMKLSQARQSIESLSKAFLSNTCISNILKEILSDIRYRKVCVAMKPSLTPLSLSTTSYTSPLHTPLPCKCHLHLSLIPLPFFEPVSPNLFLAHIPFSLSFHNSLSFLSLVIPILFSNFWTYTHTHTHTHTSGHSPSLPILPPSLEEDSNSVCQVGNQVRPGWQTILATKVTIYTYLKGELVHLSFSVSFCSCCCCL